MKLKKLNLFILFLVLCICMSIPLILADKPIDAVTKDSVAGRVNTSSGHLNVRASASASSAIVTILAKGSYVTLISHTGSWWYIEYSAGKYGYCSDAYIEVVPTSFAGYVATSSTTLNVRDGAGTSFEVIYKLNKGQTVVVLSKVGDWYWVLFDGVNTGYCSSAYIASHSSIKYPKINIITENFKQTDPKWASIKLGSSPNTMAKSGCLTCCCAIVETHRRSYIVSPGTLAYSLNYTSDGSLYWPSYFSFHNTSSGYLSVLYNNLKAGKIVIVGMKKSTGGQHWVVVNGYTGGDTLVASNFTIKDPGSSYKTNLQQLINEYPYFHRVAYY